MREISSASSAPAPGGSSRAAIGPLRRSVREPFAASSTRALASSPAKSLTTSAPAWALAAASSLTSLTAHRLGGGALPSGAQWLLPLVAALAVGVIARPMRLTSRSVGVLLVLGQLLGHVALQLGVPHAMGAAGELSMHGAGAMRGMPTPAAMAGGMPDVAGAGVDAGPGMGATRAMLMAHLIGTLCAWVIAHLLLRVADAGRSRWDALTGRMALPRIVIRRRRAAVRRERTRVLRARWSMVAPLRGPPTGRLAAL